MEKAGKEKMRGLKAVRMLMCLACGQWEVSLGNLTSACLVLTDGCTPPLGAGEQVLRMAPAAWHLLPVVEWGPLMLKCAGVFGTVV